MLKKVLDWSSVLFFLILFLVFLQALKDPVDLDLGWHLRYGEYFFRHGYVLKDNILSFVWPDYKWVQASWGYDLLVYMVFKTFGFFGLSFVGALITIAIFLILVFRKNLSISLFLFLAFIFVTQTAPLYGSGLRSQTPSALLFTLALVSYFWLKKKLNESTLKGWQFLVLPLIFLVWANMHGGFAVGLVLLWVMFAGEIGVLILRKFKKGITAFKFKSFLKLGLILLLCSVVPLINPWGLRLYEESFQHTSNINLTAIAEWMPLTVASFEWYLALFVVVLVVLVFLKRRKLEDLPFMLGFGLAAYLGFSATRFLIIFGIMTVFYLASNMQGKLKWTWQTGMAIIVIFVIVLDFFALKNYFSFPSRKLLNFDWNDYCQVIYIEGGKAKDCSEEVTQVMLVDPPTGNGYHPYNYGGYLTWRVPEVKTFIDGRMVAWERDGRTPPVLDGDRIMTEKIPVSFRLFDSKYRFGWMIVPTPSAVTSYLDNLVKSGVWQLRYRDEFYSYYIRRHEK